MMYYTRRRLVAIAKALLRRPPYPGRYQQMYDEIGVLQPTRILEVGTNDGINAARMIGIARTRGPHVDYFGFDLFESLDAGALRREFSVRTRSQSEVKRFLRAKGAREVQLFAGDTTTTLPEQATRLPTMDLIFIDGGHSFETVRSDWESVQPLIGPKTVVFFDDYPNFGIKPVVDSISRGKWDVQALPVTDRFPVERGAFDEPDAPAFRDFQFVRVQRKS